MKIVLFNGPPRCGKDTAAKYIYHSLTKLNIPIVFERMSYPNKAAFAGMMKLQMTRFFEVFPWEWQKGQTIPELGVSFRQWQIDFSEKYMKPVYGEDIFGQLFVRRVLVRHPDNIFVVPDCGFQVEINTILDYIPRKDILLVKIFREGKTFDGDSRSYITGDCETVDIFNNCDQAQYEKAALDIVKGFIHAP